MNSRNAPPPEFWLAAACCRWPPSRQRDASIEAITYGSIDWQKFVRIVKRHRIEGLVHFALRSVGVGVPRDAMAELARRAQEIAVQNMRLASESARLQKIFDAAHKRCFSAIVCWD